ncbi:MAG: beta-lactamase family protein [Bacteroidales bacterium]|nr:beta-lactamase family protein [Bacteroidales bacterium]
MKKHFILIRMTVLFCYLIAFLSISLSAKVVGTQDDLFQIDTSQFNKEINELIIKYDIPGTAIAIIKKDSIWIGTYGYADKNKKEEVSEKTIFRLGSISKSFLAIAIMQLVDEGQINLNDQVKEIISEIEMKNIWEENFPVRIIHILEHTSGIDDVHFNEGYNTTGNQELLLDDIFSKNPKSRNVRWRPGEFTSYSNDAFSMLAMIIEKVTGKRFEEYIQQNILDKIETVSTTYIRNQDNESLIAQGYTNNGTPLDYIPVLMRPSGGINSNVVDLARFVQMLLNRGLYNNTSLIDSMILNKMLYPSSSIPAQEGFILGYGSGFSSYFMNEHKFFGHGGGLPDFKSIFLFNSELEAGIVVLINKNSDYFGRFVNKVFSLLEFEMNYQKENSEYSKVEFKFDEITGYYSQANFGISLDRFPNYFLTGQTIYFEKDTLFSQEFKSEKKALIHVKGNSYKRINQGYGSVYFFRNTEGEMMLTISGKDFYKKDAVWKSVFDRLFLMFSILIIITFLLFTIIWTIKKLILKLRKRVIQKTSLLPRLIPLSAIVSLMVCLFSLSMWFGDYNNAGNISFTSVFVFIFSILFLLFSLISFWICCFKKRIEIKNRFEKVYLIIVSSTLVGLSIFLYYYEIIGLMLWAY